MRNNITLYLHCLSRLEFAFKMTQSIYYLKRTEIWYNEIKYLLAVQSHRMLLSVARFFAVNSLNAYFHINIFK
jgi:hypothetical protein